MPTVARFNGIAVIFRVRDHPPPHSHAFAGDDEVVIGIMLGTRLRGRFPAAKLRDVLAWTQRHQRELPANWRHCQAHQSVQQIPYP